MCLGILWIDTDNLLPPEDGFIPELRFRRLDCESIVSFSPRNISRYYSTSGQNPAGENSDRRELTISQHGYHPKILRYWYANYLLYFTPCLPFASRKKLGISGHYLLMGVRTETLLLWKRDIRSMKSHRVGSKINDSVNSSGSIPSFFSSSIRSFVSFIASFWC